MIIDLSNSSGSGGISAGELAAGLATKASLSGATFTGNVAVNSASASGAPALLLSGAIYSGTTPHFLIQPAGGTTPNWQSGTVFGINAPASFGGFLMDIRRVGASQLMLTYDGVVMAAYGLASTSGSGYRVEHINGVSLTGDLGLSWSSGASNTNPLTNVETRISRTAAKELSLVDVAGSTTSTTKLVVGKLKATGLPTSATGLSSGDVWRDTMTNVLMIVP